MKHAAVAELLQDELPELMACPKRFVGYVEHLARVSPAGLTHLERNRYSVPSEFVLRIVSVRVYPAIIYIVVDEQKVASRARSFETEHTLYDWRHYIALISQKRRARCVTARRSRPCPSRKKRHSIDLAGAG